jgi:hypothetical protein
VVHDEALSDFEGVISQLERGHSFMNKTFGIPHPTIGWQIDSFGHSALTPALLQKFGYEALVIHRIDNRFKRQMSKDGNLEFIWAGADLGSQTGILTHTLYNSFSIPNEINPLNPSSCWNESNNVAGW